MRPKVDDSHFAAIAASKSPLEVCATGACSRQGRDVSRLVWAAKLFVSVVLVWWLLHTVSFAPVIARMRAMRGIDVACLVGLAGTQFFLFGLRWWLVGRACAARLEALAAVRIAFISMFFNQALPATVGGDIIRAYLATREGVPPRRAVTGVLIDRVLGTIALVGLVAATLPAFYRIVHDPRLSVSITMLALIGVLSVGLLLIAGGHIASFLKRWRFLRPIGSLTNDLRGLLTRPLAIVVIALSIAIHLISVGLVMLLAGAMDLRLDPMAALVLVLPVMLVIMIPVTLAGWGVRESALIVALGQAGIAAPAALAISIAFGLVNLAASLPGGVLWLRSRSPRQDDVLMEEVTRFNLT
jgi:glycosyltransferase 2 family protein